jgi:hypothetical protein
VNSPPERANAFARLDEPMPAASRRQSGPSSVNWPPPDWTATVTISSANSVPRPVLGFHSRGIDRGRGWLGAAVPAFRYQTGIRGCISPGGRATAGAFPQLGTRDPVHRKARDHSLRHLAGRSRTGGCRYQTGIRAETAKGADRSAPLSTCSFSRCAGWI